jgi:hypothetical protein
VLSEHLAKAVATKIMQATKKTGRPTTTSSRATNDGTIAEETARTTTAVVMDEMRETTIVMDAEAIARETIGEDAEVGLPTRRLSID